MPEDWSKFEIKPPVNIPAAREPTDDEWAQYEQKGGHGNFQPNGPQRLGSKVVDDVASPFTHPMELLKGMLRGALPSPINLGGKQVMLPAPFGEGVNQARGLVQGIKDDPWAGSAPLVEAAAPMVLHGIGGLLKSGARIPVKSALGLPGVAEAYGANPAKAVLEETPANTIRPASVAKAARVRVGELNAEQEAAARASPPVSVEPVRKQISSAISEASGLNSRKTPSELQPMLDYFTKPTEDFKGATQFPDGAHTPISVTQQNPPRLGAGGWSAGEKPIVTAGKPPLPEVAPYQSAIDALGMRRQFNKDFIRSWNPALNTDFQLKTARDAYGALGDEIDKSIPGGADRDLKMSGLITAAKRAKLTDLSAGPGERILGRAQRQTGAMLPAIFGLHEAGLRGMLGAIAGQEILSSPTVKMMMGRGMYGLGSALDSPFTKAGSLGLIDTTRKREPQ